MSRTSISNHPLAEQLATLTADIRKQPASAPLRIHLSQLCMLCGDWNRAVEQLQTAAQLDASAIPMAQVYREAIRCERTREDVFAGNSAPHCFGEPIAWLAPLIEALSHHSSGQHALADELRQRVLGTADPIPFRVNEVEVEWIADGDSRLGPVCEVILNGRYGWLPFEHIQKLELEPPTDLRDLVWAPGTLTLSRGGTHPVLIPSRYPFSHQQADDRLVRGALTRWDEIGTDAWAGLGQRTWISSEGDHGMLEVRQLLRTDSTGVENV